MSGVVASRISRLATERAPSAPVHASERLRAGYPGPQRASHEAGTESGNA